MDRPEIRPYVRPTGLEAHDPTQSVAPSPANQTLAPSAASHPAADFYAANLQLIETVLTFVSRRFIHAADERDEFASYARVRLLENDQVLLRRFEGRSALRTYLVVVISRLLQDYRHRTWGKWRPSAVAKRLGPAACDLERLINRDRLPVGEAIEVMQSNDGVPEETLREIASKLPARSVRTLERPSAREWDLLIVAPKDQEADAHIEQQVALARAKKTRRALRDALATLSAEDRTLLRRRFVQGRATMEIARETQLDPQRLYRKYSALLRRLREELHRHGIEADDVGAFLSAGQGTRFDSLEDADPTQSI